MADAKHLKVYYVVNCITSYRSFDEIQAKMPETVAAHIARSKKLHEDGALLMSGAILHNPEEPLSTLAVLTSREAAEDYLKGDPFVLNGTVIKWSIREWANMFANASGERGSE